jgi:hypothetical protein
MESKLATAAKRSLVIQSQRLTHAQRLEAFLVHSRLMMDLYRVGQVRREQSSQRRS